MSQTIDTAAAIAALNRVNERETFANLPALLPMIGADKSDDGKRYSVIVKGMNSPVTVWENHAAEFNAAAGRAPKTTEGFPVVPVLLTATRRDVAERTIEGVTLPARTFYNVSARPMPNTADAGAMFG